MDATSDMDHLIRLLENMNRPQPELDGVQDTCRNHLILCFFCSADAQIIQSDASQWNPLLVICNACSRDLAGVGRLVTGIRIYNVQRLVCQQASELHPRMMYPEYCTVRTSAAAALLFPSDTPSGSGVCGPLAAELGFRQPKREASEAASAEINRPTSIEDIRSFQLRQLRCMNIIQS
jgi:hypothetical protein